MILSIDTATDRPTLALGTPDDPGAEHALAHRHDLSREIDRVVRDLVSGRHATARAIEAVIVADGPGSFTGLRIGIAFAKGLCRALDIPLLSVPSMVGAGIKAVQGSGLVCVDYDALRGQVYRAVYRRSPDAIETVQAPALVPADAPAPSGATRAGAEDASAAALLRVVGVAGGPVRVADPPSWEPDYGRPAEAEARLRARHAKG